jgi:nucleotide-binding universal stress UspA family protein
MKEQMRILIGYDGSVCADATLDDLRRAGLPREAQAVIFIVSAVWLRPPSNSEVVKTAFAQPTMASAKAVRKKIPSVIDTVDNECVLAAKEKLLRYFPAWDVQIEFSSGSPSQEIIKKANLWKPDLIVVGSQGCEGLGKFLLGRVSQKVANEACCTVRVARGTAWKDGAPVRILLGLDGSPGSEAAVKTISERVWTHGSEVRIVTAVDSVNPSANHELLDFNEWVEKFTETAANELRAVGLAVSTKIEEGNPMHALITDAEEWGAECIFVGASYDCNRVEKNLLGSVATAIVARAHCSVEVVRFKTERPT